MKNKKAIEMGFNWIFALIVGAFVLFIAVYGAFKFADISTTSVNTQTSAQLIGLLDPLETGISTGESKQLNFKKESRIHLSCDEISNKPFGRQFIAFSEKSLGNKFSEPGERVQIKTKYVFAENLLQGKSFSVFSKPFEMPFKIADLIVISSEDYCFYGAPNKIKKSIESLNLNNVVVSKDLSNCSKMTSVCFGDYDCDIVVKNLCDFNCEEPYEIGRVVKENENLYYTGDLIYAAIFSNKEIYECNIKRLMNKFNELSEVYIGKINITTSQGCSSTIALPLTNMMQASQDVNSSANLINLYKNSQVIDATNQGSGGCKLY